MKRLPLPLPVPTGFGVIRRAGATDLERIVQMVTQLAKHHGDTPTVTHDDLVRDVFCSDPWIFIVVAEMDKELIGYAAMCGSVQLQFGARGMDIHHLFTEARFRRQGVGQRLVEACKIEATSLSCRYLTVGTHPKNHEAQRFYMSLGFERRDAHPPRFSIPLGG